jgi:hypothetical protein
MNKKDKTYQDKVIICKSCGQKFPWTAGEQKFYEEKGLEPPKHCRICRSALKEAQQDKFRGKLEIIEDKKE